MSRALFEIFVGYGGPNGERIAFDVAKCLRMHRLRPFVVIPGVRGSEEYLDSEEKVLRRIRTSCDGAIMVCTRGAYTSKKFQDEANTANYRTDIPVIALVLKGSPILDMLSGRHRIKFETNRHNKKCDEIVRVLTPALMDESRELPIHSIPERPGFLLYVGRVDSPEDILVQQIRCP